MLLTVCHALFVMNSTSEKTKQSVHSHFDEGYDCYCIILTCIKYCCIITGIECYCIIMTGVTYPVCHLTSPSHDISVCVISLPIVCHWSSLGMLLLSNGGLAWWFSLWCPKIYQL